MDVRAAKREHARLGVPTQLFEENTSVFTSNPILNHYMQ